MSSGPIFPDLYMGGLLKIICRHQMEESQVAALTELFVQKCEIYYGTGSYDEKQQADQHLQDISNNPFFPECFM